MRRFLIILLGAAAPIFSSPVSAQFVYGVGGSSSQSGQQASYLGIVDTGNNIPNASSGANKYINASKLHYARSLIQNPRIIIPNFYIPAGVETGSGGDCTVSASIFWNSTFQSFLFSGALTGTVTNGTYLVSDALSLAGGPIPSGTPYLTRIWEHCPSGMIYFAPIIGGNVVADIAAGEGFQYSSGVLADLTTGGTLTPSDTVNIAGDIGIIDTTTNPTFSIFGDSIAGGHNDSVDATDNFGTVARSIGPLYGYINYGVESRTQAQFIASHAQEVLLAQYTSGTINELGANDVGGGLSAATMEAAAATIAALTPTKQNYKTTITPTTTSSDSFVTSANQTVTANEALRTTWNTYIRSVNAASNTVGYLDSSAVVETTSAGVRATVPNGGRWKAPLITSGGSVAITADGLHPNPAGSQLFNGIGFGPVQATQ